jgi:hypothetical protein
VGLARVPFLALLPSLGCANDGQRASGFSDDTVRRLDAAIAKQMKENDLPGVGPGRGAVRASNSADPPRDTGGEPDLHRAAPRSAALVIRSPLYPRLASVARIVLGLVLIWELISGNAVGALSMALFLALSFAYVLREERLPTDLCVEA